MGKPPGRARRCETFCVCKEVRDNLQTYEAKTFVIALRLPEGRLFSIFKEEQPKNRPCAKENLHSALVKAIINKCRVLTVRIVYALLGVREGKTWIICWNS